MGALLRRASAQVGSGSKSTGEGWSIRQIMLYILILLSLLAYRSVVVLSSHVQLVGTKMRGMSASWT